ncbi:TonB-dependent receptor [Sphingopyxis flava]|uniref:Outer membrane receptor proteins, mostly Fe transport n=1 Tax=Sphingopyxis flava TaxID=1507287 RepID=A0A1T5G5N5_9SPHN|nr:TonB-dependent receptor [Sphingopyxis flava]SKC03793.1 Outer membrane receptor proteins, mostly Fe transport [Sphingopyxis flava]
MTSRFNRAVAVSLTAVSMALAAQPALAQDAHETQNATQSGFDEILVTARKISESSQDLPITVAAFSGEELNNRVVLTAQDLQGVTPGLTISNSPTGGVPVFAIRGTATELGIDGGVALYYNDVPFISTIGMMGSFYDVSTVEVLKGPQGTQFGTNTTGGTISIRTNLPTDEYEGYVKAGYGNFDRREFEGMLNIPVNDEVGLRFAGNYVKRDGYIKNPDNAGVVSKDFQDENHYSLRGTLSIDTGPLLNVIIADYYNRDEKPFQAVPIRFAPSLLTLFQGAPTLESQGAKLGTYNRVFMGPNSTGVQPDFFGKASLYGIQNRTELELSDTISLRNVLGYRHDKTATSEDTCGCNVVSVNVLRQDIASQWTDDLTLRYDNSDLGLRVAVGGYYSFLRKETGINSNVLQGVFAALGFPNNVVSVNNHEVKETKSKAVYFNAEYDVTETLSLTGGFRYNWDSVSSVVMAGDNTLNPANNVDFSGFGLGIINVGSLPIFGSDFKPFDQKPCAPGNFDGYDNFNAETCSATRGVKFKAESWTFGVTNKFSDKVLGYAKISHGYLAGGTNFTLRDPGRTTYDPETNTMIEVGLKADWFVGDRPIRTNVSFYRGKISNKQVFANANYDGGGTGFGVVNAAKETVYGADVEVRFSPVENLTLDLNYNYINAKFDEFIYPGLGGPGATFVPAVDLSGATPSQTPEHQVSGAITYKWPLDVDAGEVSTTFSGYYTSSITQANRLSAFDAALGADLNELPGYFIANASLNWEEVMGSPVSLQVWARNLFDKRYLTGTNIQFATFGWANGTYGAPRTYGLSASVKF